MDRDLRKLRPDLLAACAAYFPISWGHSLFAAIIASTVVIASSLPEATGHRCTGLGGSRAPHEVTSFHRVRVSGLLSGPHRPHAKDEHMITNPCGDRIETGLHLECFKLSQS